MPLFMAKVAQGKGCWLWTGGTGSSGKRPIFHSQYSHRWLYERTVGQVPEDLELDHACKNKMCVRPDHMEPVTPAENKRRARLDVCRNGGHDLTDPKNIHWDKRGRRRGCYECLKARARAYYHNQKG